jgi:DNA-binding transcriptional LysR family regulator
VDWDDLRYLLAVHRAGSLTRAARTLRVDKATVGRRLTALSQTLGAEVIEHLPRGVRLTRAGELAAATAERVDAEIAALQGEAGGGDASVRLTAPIWFAKHVLMPALPAFRKRHPKVELGLLSTSDVLDLPGRRADVALRNLRPTQAGLVVKPAGTLGSGLYASRTYLAERGRPRGRNDLASHHLLAYENRITYVPELAWLERAQVPVSFRATDALALLEATLGGLGIAVLPCFLGDAEPSLERLTPLGLGHEEIMIVTHESARKSPAVRAAVDWLAALWKQHAARLAGEGRASSKRGARSRS